MFRNRRAMAWIVGYTVHTWELAALRAWAVTFLDRHHRPARRTLLAAGPAVLFTLAGLACIAVSVTGNETAQRYGRSRVVLWAMTAAAALSLATGWTTGVSTVLAAIAVLVWNTAIYLDSSALTAGTVQAADPHLRGATMGLHSMAGYAGGFSAHSASGLVLDRAGGDGVLGWGLAFGHVALVTLAGLVALRMLGGEARRVQCPVVKQVVSLLDLPIGRSDAAGKSGHGRPHLPAQRRRLDARHHADTRLGFDLLSRRPSSPIRSRPHWICRRCGSSASSRPRCCCPACSGRSPAA